MQRRQKLDAVVVRDFYKKFYNYIGRVPNRCSSSIGKTRGLLSFSKEIENVEALENVIEDEPHFFTEIVDNDLRALAMITKHFMRKGGGWLAKHLIVSNMGLGGGGLVVHGVKSSRESKNGEVIGSGVELGVIKSSSGEIPGETIGKRGGDMMGLSGGPV
ncbi:hypothetical protein Tco_0906303 [Tanacetum coccineum]